jgi:nitrogen fixation/metabolism regulation signal transduction histidine kinase
VKSSDEVGRLTATFNQMKHAMAQQLTTQQALHREEVRNLAQKRIWNTPGWRCSKVR